MEAKKTGNGKIDYRNIVALFSKALTTDMSEPPKGWADMAGKDCGNWTVLGYFDFLQVYPLPRENRFWLSDILKHNQDLSARLDGDYYFHPFHLTTGRSESADEEEYRRFWTENGSMPFLFLTLVQEAKLGSAKKIQGAVMTQGKYETVKRVCYRTMDLSDLVVVWRSDSMHDIFQAIHELYQMEEVGDMSTFSTISQDFINAFTDGDTLNPDDGREFFASARYVVRSARESYDYLQQLKAAGIDISHIYFSTGMEDLHMLQEHMSLADFMRFLRAHLEDSHRRASEASRRRAFFESSTRLGIMENGVNAASPSGKPEALREARKQGSDRGEGEGSSTGNAESALSDNCRSLLTQFQAARERASDVLGPYEISWMKPASNLLNALADMSKNWVMDGFCYLIYDAARLFCQKIEKRSALRQPMKTKEETERVQRFIRGWGGLMEQATRTDGRFIQMPGFSPAICEIPAHLLEFYLSVVMYCADLMASGPEERDVDVALLLVPKICRRMKVIAILEKARSKDHLLYVDIPMEMLYEPASVLCCLCHELAHYVGERWRERQSRGNKIIYSAAYELACQLKIPSDSVIQEIYFNLKDLCERKDKTAISYAESLSILVRMGIKSLVSDDTVFSKWHKLYQDSRNRSSEQTRFTQFESEIYRNQILADTTDLFDDIENLIYLFRECYADIAMLYLLNPSETMYKNFAEQEIQSLMSGQKEAYMDRQYYVLVERWGLVIRVAYQRGLWERGVSGAADNPTMERFYRDIDQFIAWFDALGGDIKEHRSKETLQQVFDYLIDCYDTIDKPLGDKNSENASRLCELRQLFAGLSEHYDVDYQTCEDYTELYRETILKKRPQRLA